MKCFECSKEGVCIYRVRLSELVFDSKGLYRNSLASLVSEDAKKYEGLIEWMGNFADFCPQYEFRVEEE